MFKVLFIFKLLLTFYMCNDRDLYCRQKCKNDFFGCIEAAKMINIYSNNKIRH